MLKRSLFAVTLAAFTLVTGTITGTAQASDPSVRASARHVTLTMAGQPNPSCMWKDGCYKCYSYRTAKWTIEHCDGEGEGEGVPMASRIGD